MAIDRRVARTRTALADALVALIRRKPYDEITVEDILVEANVGRATFYAHFTSKDDLLARSLDRLRALLVAAFEGNDDAPFPRGPSWSPSRTLFEHVAQFADVQSALGAGRGGPILWAALEEAIGAFLRAVLPRQPGVGVPRELVVRDQVARVTTVLRWWLEERPDMSAAQAHEVLERLLSERMPAEAHGWRAKRS
ncbi:MAG: TetR/AcrR family transcriptional regulator [Rhizobiaceae bacterium]|nr:TetR/AcrR family transcriptional regulator [Rhizobiaceae bacterium]MCV0404755.1 TetR/AcrR family transcriptional regulator [Rhizobiaceae bacterium]